MPSIGPAIRKPGSVLHRPINAQHLLHRSSTRSTSESFRQLKENCFLPVTTATVSMQEWASNHCLELGKKISLFFFFVTEEGGGEGWDGYFLRYKITLLLPYIVFFSCQIRQKAQKICKDFLLYHLLVRWGSRKKWINIPLTDWSAKLKWLPFHFQKASVF